MSKNYTVTGLLFDSYYSLTEKILMRLKTCTLILCNKLCNNECTLIFLIYVRADELKIFV